MLRRPMVWNCNFKPYILSALQYLVSRPYLQAWFLHFVEVYVWRGDSGLIYLPMIPRNSKWHVLGIYQWIEDTMNR